MGEAVTAPNGTALMVRWDERAQLWVCSPSDRPDYAISAEDRFLEGALAEALDFDVAHDELPAWLRAFAEQVRGSGLR
jgi:hypothetical protein